MMEVFTILFVSLLSITIFFYFRRKIRYRNLPPGPTGIPLLGNILEFDEDEPHHVIAKWGKEYGGIFTFWMGPHPTIAVTDLSLMKEAFLKQGENYSARPYSFSFNYFVGTHGIVNIDGPQWKEQRRFTLQTLREFGFGKSLMEDKILAQVENLIGWIQKDTKKGGEGVLDPAEYIQYAVGNIIWDLLFGATFEKGDRRFKDFYQVINENLTTLTSLGGTILDSYPWLRFIPIVRTLVTFDTQKRQAEEILKLLHEEMDKRKLNFDPDADAEDFTAAYLKEMKKRELSGDMGYFSESQWLVVILDLVVAGMETTITTLKWALLFLVHNPEVQKKMRQEIDEEIGSDGFPTWEDRNHLPYTTACIHEVQRLANIVGFNLPHTVHEETTLGGYRIPRGVAVLPQISALHKDPEYFPEPEKFDPSRFLSADGQKVEKSEALLPFSIGKRSCLGESLARMELFLILTSLMQKFEFSVVSEDDLPTLKGVLQFTRAPTPYQIRVKERK